MNSHTYVSIPCYYFVSQGSCYRLERFVDDATRFHITIDQFGECGEAVLAANGRLSLDEFWGTPEDRLAIDTYFLQHKLEVKS